MPAKFHQRHAKLFDVDANFDRTEVLEKMDKPVEELLRHAMAREKELDERLKLTQQQLMNKIVILTMRLKESQNELLQAQKRVFLAEEVK